MKKRKTHEELAEKFGEFCEQGGKDLSSMDDKDIRRFLGEMVRTYRQKHNKSVTNAELIEALGCYPEKRVLVEVDDGSFMDITAENIGYCRVEFNAYKFHEYYNHKGPHRIDNGGEEVLVISHKKINDNPPKPFNPLDEDG